MTLRADLPQWIKERILGADPGKVFDITGTIRLEVVDTKLVNIWSTTGYSNDIELLKSIPLPSERVTGELTKV